MIQSVFVCTCAVCRGVEVLSANEFLEILTNPRKVLICSEHCMDLYNKFTPATLD